MTDEHLAPIIRTWLQGTDRPPAESRRSTGQIMARLPEREGRRRWWRFRRLALSVNESPTTDQTTHFEPTPIPATNGHSSTVTGRTQSMFSPAKTITASALVFAIGGVLLIALPFDQQSGGVPEAATEETSGEAAPFEGVTSYGSTNSRGVEETMPNGVVRNRGQIWTLSSAGLSGPRLQGTVSNMWNWDEFRTGEPYQIEVGGFRIKNDGGAWQMRPVISILFPDGEYSVWTGIFDGEDGTRA